jgi:hypothetical protein
VEQKHNYISTDFVKAEYKEADPSGPRSLRRKSAAARFLGLQVRISPESWLFVSCEYCGLSGRGLCDGPISRILLFPLLLFNFFS